MRGSLAYLAALLAVASGAAAGWWSGSSTRRAESELPVRPAVARPERAGGDASDAAPPALGALRRALRSGGSTDWTPLLAALELEALDGNARAEAVSLLLALYRRGVEDHVASAVLLALEHAGGPEAAWALAEIGSGGGADALTAIMRLSRLDDRDAADALAGIIEAYERRGEVASAAVRALGRTRLRSLTPFLVSLSSLGHETSIRRDAAEALGRIADPDGVEALAALLEDPDIRVRTSAVRALGRIRSAGSEEVLERHLARESVTGLERRLVEEALGGLRGAPSARFR